MNDSDSPDLAAVTASRATDLIADFHARHEAWRRQGEDLARLRADARAAASREADAILMHARGDIRRIIVDARRGLLALTTQLHAIDEQTGGRAEPDGDEDVPESVLQARRELQKLLTDIRPDLDEIDDQAKQFGDAAAMVAPSAPTPSQTAAPAPAPAPVAPAGPVQESDINYDDVLKSLGPTIVEHARADFAADAFVPPPMTERPESPSRAKKGWFAIFGLVGVVGVAGAGMYFSGYLLSADELKPPMARIPQVKAASPTEIPTLTASVIGLPANSSGAQPTSTSGPALSLDLEVRRATVVESSVDNNAPVARSVEAGETVRLQAAHGISISARDAGALFVSVNGGPRAPLGPDGQPTTRRFALDGAPTAQ